MIETEPIILEEALLDHLTIPESAMRLWKERIPAEVLSDEGIAQALEFVVTYIDKFREPPPASVITAEIGYTDLREPSVPIDYVLEKLRERYQRQELRRVVKQIARKSDSPQEALDFGFQALAEIKASTRERKDITDNTEFASVIERYERRKQAGPGVTFGFPQVDEVLGGLRKDCLYFVIARPKRYKSWHLIKSAVEAWKMGETVVVNTLEMGKEEVQDRILCMIAKIPWDMFVRGHLLPQHMDKINETQEQCRQIDNKLHILKPPVTERTVPHMARVARELGAKCLYIDQLSFIQSMVSSDTRHVEVARICNDLKEASADFPVYCAAQFNREAANMNEMGDLSKIGLSDAVGQTADMLLGLYANKDMKASGIYQFGTIDSRSFEHALWEAKVDLSIDSNFRILDRVD